MIRRLRRSCPVLASATATVALLLAAPATAPAATYPVGFSERTVFSGLTNPTAVRFASDGRVFVAEKSGLVKVFDSLSDSQPDVFADLRTQVHNFWDRGLLGLALDPNFPDTPYVYVLYTHDAAIGGTAPRWGTAGATSDGCPTPPGATGRRLRRERPPLAPHGVRQLDGRAREQVLIEDWCQQYPSHSIGTLDFGNDGALYVSGGDGASFNFMDYGQDGSPLNPCGDPPGGVGSALTPPTAEGGALRSQDLRTLGRPDQPGRRAAARGPGDRRWASRQSERRERLMPTRGGSSRTECATRSVSACAPGPARSGSATWAGTRGRRSSGSRTRPRR